MRDRGRALVAAYPDVFIVLVISIDFRALQVWRYFLNESDF